MRLGQPSQIYLEYFDKLPEVEIARKAKVSRQRINQLKHFFGLGDYQFKPLHNKTKLGRICPQCSGVKSPLGRICQACYLSPHRKTLICEWCGKSFIRAVSEIRSNHPYCSKKCQGSWLGTNYGFKARKEREMRKYKALLEVIIEAKDWEEAHSKAFELCRLYLRDKGKPYMLEEIEDSEEEER